MSLSALNQAGRERGDPSRSPCVPLWRRRRLILPMLIAGAVIAWLYFVPPQNSAFYPRCLFRQWIGWQCPGCGGLRAAHELLHGRIWEAFRLNALFVLLLPLAGLYLASGLWQAWTGRLVLTSLRRPAVVWVLVVIAIAFAISRNVAGHRF